MTNPSTSTARMRRVRERKRDGTVIVSIDVTRHALADIERLGWIAEGNSNDPQAISAGISALCEEALRQEIQPSICEEIDIHTWRRPTDSAGTSALCAEAEDEDFDLDDYVDFDP